MGGRRLPRIRTLPVLPQLTDHVAYRAVVGAVLAARAGHAGEVVAVRSLGATPERVFGFLADLRNHWLLEDRFVALGGLDDDEGGGPRGGRVRLTGPWASAGRRGPRVLSARPPTAVRPGRLAGRAEIGRSTTGRVAWEIAAGQDGGSLVTLRGHRARVPAGPDAATPRPPLAAAHLRPRPRQPRPHPQSSSSRAGDLFGAAPPRADGGRARRDRKRRFTTALARSVVNPIMRRAIERGIAPPGYALLETTGRTSGLPRRTPVGNGLGGDTFWIVAEHGRSAAHVRYLQADPRVRVKVGRTWRTGTAVLLPDDDARERQRLIGRRFNAAVVRLMGTDLLTVRVDLEPSTLAGNDRKRNS